MRRVSASASKLSVTWQNNLTLPTPLAHEQSHAINFASDIAPSSVLISEHNKLLVFVLKLLDDRSQRTPDQKNLFHKYFRI
jgi:hypothetical protein